MRLFLSHTWKRDSLGRNTHSRVREVRDALHALGAQTWFDEDFMVDDIDSSMAAGIDDSDVVCVFLTAAYCRKVQSAAQDPRVRDNCYKEFSYAQTAAKRCVAVVMEPELLDVTRWPSGIVKLHLGCKLYVDGSGDDASAVAAQLLQTLSRISERSTPPRAPPRPSVPRAPLSHAPLPRPPPRVGPHHRPAPVLPQAAPSSKRARWRWLMALVLVFGRKGTVAPAA